MDKRNSEAQMDAFTEEQLQNEFDYMMAQQMLQNVLENGMISLSEYDNISAKNLEKFSPELASIIA